MKYFTLFYCIYWIFSPFESRSQIISNGDFEVMDTCPTNLGQVPLCLGWEDVVLNADYYNCGFTSISYPTNPTAFTGTGYMGFASYGTPNGAAEAFGQVLPVALMPNTSGNITLASKKVNFGTYSGNCGGVAIYGIKGTMINDTIGIHISQLPNAFLLALTPMVQNTSWSTNTISFTTPDTINAIVITNEYTPGCAECIFIDAVSILLNPSGTSEFEYSDIHIYPIPSQGGITIETDQIATVKSVNVIDVLGKTANIKLTISDNKTIIENLPGGVSFVQLQFEDGKFYTQKIVNIN